MPTMKNLEEMNGGGIEEARGVDLRPFARWCIELLQVLHVFKFGTKVRTTALVR